VWIGLPAPSCSRCLCPEWSHHTPRTREPQPDFGTKNLIPVTNAIEALTSKLRRAVRTRGHFPNDDAAMKLLYLVLNHAAEEWKRPPREWSEAKTPVRRRLRREVRQPMTQPASRTEFLTVPVPPWETDTRSPSIDNAYFRRGRDRIRFHTVTCHTADKAARSRPHKRPQVRAQNASLIFSFTSP
jgi:hypothetical protein